MEAQASFVTGLQRRRGLHMTLLERVQQILGPSILVVADVIGSQQPPDEQMFRRAEKAQGPLLEAERLVGAAFDELQLAAEISTIDQLQALVPQIPSGLRAELASAVAELAEQSGDAGVFAMRRGELEASAQADRLVTTSKLTNGLSPWFTDTWQKGKEYMHYLFDRIFVMGDTGGHRNEMRFAVAVRARHTMSRKMSWDQQR